MEMNYGTGKTREQIPDDEAAAEKREMRYSQQQSENLVDSNVLIIKLSRCVCVHALPQVLDEFLHYILPERSIIPSLLPDVLQPPESSSHHCSRENTESEISSLSSLDDLSTTSAEEFHKSLARLCLNDADVTSNDDDNKLKMTPKASEKAAAELSPNQREPFAFQKQSLPIVIRRKDDCGKAEKATKRKDKFRNDFLSVRTVLTESFRSFNAGKISDCVFIIGASAASIKEIYHLSWPLGCAAHDDGACAALNARELQRITAQLFAVQLGYDLPYLSSSSRRLFIFLKATRDAKFPVDVTAKESFRIPCSAEAKRRKITLHTFNIQHGKTCLTDAEDKENIEENRFIWYRFDSFLEGFEM